MSASPVLSVPCLPSCVSLSGGVLWHTALSGLVMAMVAGVAMILVVVVAVADGSNGSGSYGNGSGNGRLEW